MAFEELPDDVAKFFSSGGELPESLIQPAPTPEPTPASAPVATSAPETAPVATAATPEPVTAPASNPYLERLLAEKDVQVKNLADQMAALKAQMEATTKAPAPDPTIDPLGYMTHQMKELQDQMKALAEQQTQAQTATKQQTDQQRFMGAVNNQVNEFVKTHPDYQAAYQHLIATRTQDFRDLGMTDAQISQAIGNEEMTITQNAMMMGKNPAEVVYGFAKRYGFQSKAAVPTPENKLDTIKKGIEASQTVERGTPPTTGQLTIDNIANASEADINRAVEKDWESLFGLRKSIF